MNVFAEIHHDSLFNSLQILFEERLGGKLYRPIGEEWFKEGYWLIAAPYNNDPGTITQFLGIRDEVYRPTDGSRALNEIKERGKGYYIIKGIKKDHNAVTLEQFKNISFDIIIASYLPHYQTFTELRDKYQPKAKVICQAGNNWLNSIDWNITKNLMASCAPDSNVPTSVNKVFYHQEFSLDIYNYEAFQKTNIIRSFVNTFDISDLFKEDYLFWLELEKKMPEFKFESYGASNREGSILGDEKIAEFMRGSIPLHLKKGGDGYGYCIHQYFAAGRAPIVKMQYYKNQLAGQLMEDKITCIAIDGLNVDEAVDKIRHFVNNEYEKMCLNAYNKFKSIVNFDSEEKMIREFLSTLQ